MAGLVAILVEDEVEDEVEVEVCGEGRGDDGGEGEGEDAGEGGGLRARDHPSQVNRRSTYQPLAVMLRSASVQLIQFGLRLKQNVRIRRRKKGMNLVPV